LQRTYQLFIKYTIKKNAEKNEFTNIQKPFSFNATVCLSSFEQSNNQIKR